MPERTRAHLRQEFQDGERPSGADFVDVFDSALNKQDDGVSIDPADNTLVLSRGLRLGDSDDTLAGTLRFNSGQPEWHDGVAFQPFGGGGGGGAFQAVGGGPDVAYTGGGTVGIGNFVAPSTYQFEVELGATSNTADQVRFGNMVLHRAAAAQAGSAYASHHSFANNNDYALRQRSTGEVTLNAPAGQPIFLAQGGSNANARLTIDPAGTVLVGIPTALGGADAQSTLHVGGHASKNVGGDLWDNASDARVKEAVEPYAAGLAEVCAIRPVSYRYNGKAGTVAGAPGVGIIGQEIETVLPETIRLLPETSDGIDDMRIYNGSPLLYALVNAVRELSDKVADLEAKLAPDTADTPRNDGTGYGYAATGSAPSAAEDAGRNDAADPLDRPASPARRTH